MRNLVIASGSSDSCGGREGKGKEKERGEGGRKRGREGGEHFVMFTTAMPYEKMFRFRKFFFYYLIINFRAMYACLAVLTLACMNACSCRSSFVRCSTIPRYCSMVISVTPA